VRVLKFLFLLAVVAAGFAAYEVLVPYGPQSETFVDIPPGTRTPGLARALQDAGVIRSGSVFELLRLIKGGTLKAGEYRFDHPDTLLNVYARLARGDVFTLTLTVPEGYNIYDIAQAAEAAKLGTRDGFLAATRSQTALIADIDPQAESLEGYLFPDTYHFSRHATDAQMVTAMVHRFRQAATQLGLNAQVRQTVIMASLVEKETGVSDERSLVAGVFENRLEKNMPLQTDPSVVYAALLENRYRGTIYASDLANPSPYNTYRHGGLPPGPICNPGVASLKAAMHPAQTDYLYFVSDAAGHSRFSVDLSHQNQNVQTYRQSVGPQAGQ